MSKIAQLDDSTQIRTSSSWGSDEIATYLATTRSPLRLALQSAEAPLIVPLWFVFHEGRFWCASPANAYVTKLANMQARCGFDVSENTMPYKGVRGQGTVSVSKPDGAKTLQRLVDRYLGGQSSPFAQWLLARQDDEIAIQIRPDWVTAWDFSSRMATVSVASEIQPHSH